MKTPPLQSWSMVTAFALVLLVLPWLIPADGRSHGAFQQFLGRFHPLAVHFPLALLLVLPILEVAGQRRPALREAAGFVLTIAALCSAGTAVLGILLAHAGGFTHQTVGSHLWSGIALTLVVLFCTLIRPAWQAGASSWLYPGCLVVVLLLTIWTGHQGGTITYGKGYLTEFLPRMSARRTYPPVDPTSVYATRIQPIFNAKCVSCHGPAKRKGGFALDSYAHLMDGGSSGEVIEEGHPERSILFTRITLPPSDRKFMPSEGKPPLSASEVDLIRAWIQQGASPLASPPTSLSAPPSK